MHARLVKSTTVVLAIVAATGCASLGIGGGSRAEAVMRNAGGTEIGRLSIRGAGAGLRITGRLTNLTPGSHGLHVHAVGQCAPTFAAAGGHWNPTARQHGLDNPNGPHHGDAPNTVADASGAAQVDITTAGGSIDAVLDTDGAAIVVHAAADDQRTDPAGNSGDRIACGVITRTP
jgi:Cu-Zn family superoxide dismutase